MKIEPALIDKLADLSRLEFNDQERASIAKDLERMLAFVEKINELNTDNVEPLIHITQAVNRTQPDVPEPPVNRADALKNAPKKDSDYIRVPKVLQK